MQIPEKEMTDIEYKNIGKAYLKLGEFDKAVDHLSTALNICHIKKSGTVFDILELRSFCYFKLNKLD